MKKATIPHELVRSTLFGPEVIQYYCNTCGKLKNKSQFYVKAYSKNEVRDQCKSCWKKNRGRCNG